VSKNSYIEALIDGQIDISDFPDAYKDPAVCFKLKLWSLQCKFARLVDKYFKESAYSVKPQCSIEELLTFKRGLEVLNAYDPRDIEEDTTDYNFISYSEILKILQVLFKKY
jgi:hypothetical protein